MKSVTHSERFLANIGQKRCFNLKIDHIAIAVEDVEKSTKEYQEALDVKDVEFEIKYMGFELNQIPELKHLTE